MSGTYLAVCDPVKNVVSYPVSGSSKNIAPQDLTGWGDESGVWVDENGATWNEE